MNELRRIKILPETVANKIAAGEVIERPAAALKELIENSLDAGARHINITLRNGGMDLLETQDDGAGIIADDLMQSILRHATSKITTVDDFSSLETFGFRGEALASLAAVTDFSIASRVADNSHGYRYSPPMAAPKPQPMAVGTTVSARSLFANFPARRRFLRSTATENAHCVNTVIVAALNVPEVAFTLISNDKQRLRVAATDAATRRVDIFPKLKDNTVAVQEKASSLSLHGVIFSPHLGSTAKNLGQFFYVNGRYVQDKLLRRAVSDALRHLWHDGQPGYILSLNLPLTMTDVNMHPAKLEIRFSEPRAIFDFIFYAVNKAMSAPLGKPLPIDNRSLSQPSSSITPAASNNLTPAPVGFTASAPPSFTSAKQGLDAWKQMFEELPSSTQGAAHESSALFDTQPLGRALGQLHDIYIIAENHNGLIIVDMHAAHERILFEELKNACENSAMPMQKLLLPVLVTLSPLQTAKLTECQKQLPGVTATLKDDNTATVDEVASLIACRCDAAALLIEILDSIANASNKDQSVILRDLVLSCIACHAAVRANDRLSIDDMNALLRRMEATERSGVCNHGRPCWQQIERCYFDNVFRRGR